jgi:hypothetical protein
MKKTLDDKMKVLEDWGDTISFRAAIAIKYIIVPLFLTTFLGPYMVTETIETHNINKIEENYGKTEVVLHCNNVVDNFSNKNKVVQIFSLGKYDAAKDYLIRLK